MIRLENVSKYYGTPSGRHYVLDNVSLTIPDKAKVGVLGPNGAGKSTLMRLMAGVDSPNKGKITRTGSISWPMGLANSLQGSLTGKENARFACQIQGMPRSEIERATDGMREFADIGKYFEMPVRTYSSGMRARLNFAIAMGFVFDCYIVDELTAVGDKDFREKSAKAFRDKRDIASFIKVSHNLAELKQECDTGLVLHSGTAKFYSSIDEALDAYNEYLDLKSSTKDSSKTPGK